MTHSSAVPEQPGLAHALPEPRRRNIIVGAILISTFMAAAEITIISTAMPLIVGRLGGFELFSWVFSIYILAQAVMTPLYGKFADLYGRRTVYVGSTALFLVGSLLCGFAWSMPAMILFRAIQGLGGAGLIPLGTVIISDVTAPHQRMRFLGYISGVWGVAAIIGPLLGAFIVSVVGWPFVFWINIPFGLVTMALVARFLDERGERPTGQVGLLGPALLTIGVGAVMVALVQHGSVGVPGSIGLLVVGGVALMLLGVVERRVAEPLVPAHLWRNPMVLAANVSALLGGAVLIGFTAFLPTYVQGVTGGTALLAGACVGGMTVTWTVASIGLGRFKLAGHQRTAFVAGSLSLLIGSLALLAGVGARAPVTIGIGCILVGAGLGTVSLLAIAGVQSSVSPADRGRATSLFYFFRLFGQALGAAAFGGVLNAALSSGDVAHHDVVRDLVDPLRRATLPAAELTHWTDMLGQGLWSVFLLATLFAAGMLAVALLVPRRAGDPT